MKKLSIVAVAILMVSNFANAISIPGWERPIKGAALNYIAPTKPQFGLRAMYLSLNQEDGASEPTSFTLTEDTGIRCVMAPCPSSRKVEFRITAIIPGSHSDVTRYEAVEVLRNIPPYVKIARRHLYVTESTRELVAPGGGGFTSQEVWQVEVKGFATGSMMYYGYPEILASIASMQG